MKRRLRRKGTPAHAVGFVICLLATLHLAGQTSHQPHYRVQAAATEGNLSVFPVAADAVFNTTSLMTLEEGIRSGQVVVTETSEPRGLVRQRTADGGIWSERPPEIPVWRRAQVNELAITNKSGRALVLLAGEIVTGGKQDRVVGRDLIIPAHSKPVALGVFCVEPHRWTSISDAFEALHSSMAQPSVRSSVMVQQDQQEVWSEVARSRAAFAGAVSPAEARELGATSSYAATVKNQAVQQRLDSLAGSIERSYDRIFQRVRERNAVGAVVAVDGEIIWADIFASPELLQQYWPKLIRSYAAEALIPRMKVSDLLVPTTSQAQFFLEKMGAEHETVETEPGVYRNTQIKGVDFDAFVLTALLPSASFNVHLAKMKR